MVHPGLNHWFTGSDGQRGRRWNRRGGMSTVTAMAKPGPEYQEKVAELVASAPPLTRSRRESIERIFAHATADGVSAGPAK